MDGTLQSRDERAAPLQPRDPPAVLAPEVERLSSRVLQLEREMAELEGLVAMAAHELQVPLVMAEACAAIVAARLEEEEHADSRRDLEALSLGVARTRRLVETLLQDARSSGGELEFRRVGVDAMVRDCIALLRPEIEARRARVDVAELPDVWGHEGLLSGVFMNLIVNALKYSPRRRPVIRISAVEEADRWRFAVDSGGTTLRAEDRERLFEPFNRGPGVRRTRGSGLGLTICHRIVVRHGGTIGITDANGSGNRFHFTIPGLEH